MKKIRYTLELIKFSHSIFALPFALTSFLFAHHLSGRSFSFALLLLILLAMVTARNTAMAFNRVLDRKIDAKNPRTAGRHLPQGLLSIRYVAVFIAINIALFLAVCKAINPLAFRLSPLALLIICGYSFAKRFTSLAHYFLGLSLAIAPVGAWIAVTGQMHFFPLLLGSGVLFWVSGFDILYALQDEAFDRDHGLHSIPAAVGTRRALLLSRLSHLLAVAFWLAPTFVYPLGPYYFLAVVVMALFLAWEQSLVRATDLSRLDQAFFTLNGIVSLVFLVGAIAEIGLNQPLQP